MLSMQSPQNFWLELLQTLAGHVTVEPAIRNPLIMMMTVVSRLSRFPLCIMLSTVGALMLGHAGQAQSVLPETVEADTSVQSIHQEPPLEVPTDHWAYQAVMNLVQTYGCLSGYPDGTFRGDQALTRNEFAAAMNACMTTLSTLIQSRQADDDQAVRDLLDSMTTLQGDLDELEGRVGVGED